jgi:hypothetical protein
VEFSRYEGGGGRLEGQLSKWCPCDFKLLYGWFRRQKGVLSRGSEAQSASMMVSAQHPL